MYSDPVKGQFERIVLHRVHLETLVNRIINVQKACPINYRVNTDSYNLMNGSPSEHASKRRGKGSLSLA